MVFSRTMTAPTNFRGQVDREATTLAIFMKYSSQEARSAMAISTKKSAANGSEHQDEMDESDPKEAIEPSTIPIDGTLDLHTFSPRETRQLLEEYVRECSARGISRLRIIHGKGTGALREKVHSLLRRMPEVDGFALAGEESGGWGATLVTLKPVRKCE
jgi:DNA-nicking Smr family endonuclease